MSLLPTVNPRMALLPPLLCRGDRRASPYLDCMHHSFSLVYVYYFKYLIYHYGVYDVSLVCMLSMCVLQHVCVEIRELESQFFPP